MEINLIPTSIQENFLYNTVGYKRSLLFVGHLNVSTTAVAMHSEYWTLMILYHIISINFFKITTLLLQYLKFQNKV